MGKHEGWAQPSGVKPNGLLPNQVASVTRVLDAERWMMAEERTAELIACIQPNQPSEERRKAVALYVKRLIMKCFSCQVFTFGSVPLKTYLPDGDIDLTACSNNEDLKDTWANSVRDALENEEKSENAEFRVKEVQYIQAEVKIIKCLVENIVVDISFNQVGGLCTLCFLEEIDALIKKDHLFKRSIILIKAWCYYESRILGAHHGLISTYALETLVLYIFHVFNNSFAGPLEVLYRFLEFFSNFDWENFCVSLWGPVPISSLPDMTAEPPQRDSCDLLLSKQFLEGCSRVYAVTPDGQGNQGQPFVSKHFNVIDPLRTNNNLGRSVSKGNFFRIRSAFAFGAKRLARLLECPHEDLISEVNQFFMNTWERHGSGNRPDAPSPSLRHIQPVKNIPVEESNNIRSASNIKKRSENPVSRVGYENLAEDQIANRNSQHSRNLDRVNKSSVSRTQSQKINSRVSDQFERSNGPTGTAQTERDPKPLKSNYIVNDSTSNGQTRFPFARTRSSPDLTDSSAEVFSRGRRGTMAESAKSLRLDHSDRRNHSGTEASGSQSTKLTSADDPMSSINTSSQSSLQAASDTNSVSNSYHDDVSFATMNEELASVSQSLEIQQEMNQEEQDLVNLMASAKLHDFNGPIQLPIHMASSHLPVTLSPLLASTAHAQRNWGGVFTPNLSFFGHPWAHNMQIPQGYVSPPMSHYFPNPGLSVNHDEDIEPTHDISAAAEPSQEDNDQWQNNHAGLTGGFNSENKNPEMFHVDGKQQSSVAGFNFVSWPQSSNAGGLLWGHPKFDSEDAGPIRDNNAEIFQNQTSRGTDVSPSSRTTDVRVPSVSQSSSSRSKTSYEISRDAPSGKISRTSRDKWGKKPTSLPAPTTTYGKAKMAWQLESTSEQLPAEANETREWNPTPTMGNNIPEQFPTPLVFTQARSHQVPGYEPTHISGSDPMIPIAPVLVGPPRQRATDNSGLVPVAFVPAGPLVPFYLIQFASVTNNSDGASPLSPSEQNFSPQDNLDQPESHVSSTALRTPAAAESSNEHEPDILKSDFDSHLQNLLYGRYCQDTRQGPFICQPPVLVPPVYLQGHFPWDGPGRPVSANANLTQMMGYAPRFVPMVPLKPGSERPSGVFQRHGEEAPRYRGGTGTYLPNPVPFRDRQASTRSYRRNYNSERGDQGDREGSWISAKARAAGRGHGHQVERSNFQPENQSDRHRQSYKNDPHRHEPVSSNLAPGNSFRPTNSNRSPRNLTYGMYPPPPVTNPNGVINTGPGSGSSPVMMVYSYDQGGGYGPSGEPLEFGSLGPVHPSGLNEAPQSGEEIPVGALFEQRHGPYRGSSSCSSPDQPSSPQLRG
uniref:Polymerase nucleotidyl transferase domain-containing protein n=1 Tax=Ananas comosus var. bracteatus TaxID=296719 RepID=A0A6V7Q4R6_ANACO|nr:unnamed protein product [Ananas comosus var. bracteatus]